MLFFLFFFFFKQKTAYEMRISDWSPDVCSSDLSVPASFANRPVSLRVYPDRFLVVAEGQVICEHQRIIDRSHDGPGHTVYRSEEHTSELQSLMRISYAVFCLKKKKYEQNKR